jgi:methylated-DNA-[protein]-cysteine S-methyltransferase
MMQFESMPRATFPTALGTCALSWSKTGLTGFELPEAPVLRDDTAARPDLIAGLIDRVRQHLSGTLQDFSDVRYDFSRVPAFPREVYHATLAVKAGHTASYGDIAAGLGYAPGMSRAVGTALGANPWPLLVPCHRIVSAEGKMTGFSGPGGVKTKLRLLALEGAQLFAE